jgi:hypothetical protein
MGDVMPVHQLPSVVNAADARKVQRHRNPEKRSLEGEPCAEAISRTHSRAVRTSLDRNGR